MRPLRTSQTPIFVSNPILDLVFLFYFFQITFSQWPSTANLAPPPEAAAPHGAPWAPHGVPMAPWGPMGLSYGRTVATVNPLKAWIPQGVGWAFKPCKPCKPWPDIRRIPPDTAGYRQNTTRWIHGPMDPWIHGSMDHGSMDHGSMIHGFLVGTPKWGFRHVFGTIFSRLGPPWDHLG